MDLLQRVMIMKKYTLKLYQRVEKNPIDNFEWKGEGEVNTTHINAIVDIART